MAPLRLGLIGAGRWGRNYIKTIAGLDAVRLTALASSNPESAQWLTQDCVIQRDWRAILDPRLIDAVIIATPAALHATMAGAAIEAGLPVLVEKPLTLSLDEARSLRDLVARRQGFVMIDHTHLFNPAYRRMKELLRNCGPLRALSAQAGNTGPFRRDAPVLWDWGAHDVALCLDLLGTAPSKVEARRIEHRQVDNAVGENLELHLFFPTNVEAQIRIGNLMPKCRRLAALTDSCVMVYDDLAEHKLTRHEVQDNWAQPRGEGLTLPISSKLPLTQVVEEFAAVVGANKYNMESLDLGVAVVTILDACEKLV